MFCNCMAKESNRSILLLARYQLVCFALRRRRRGARRNELAYETDHRNTSIQSTSKARMTQQGNLPLFVFMFVRLMKESGVENKQGR